MAAWCTTIGLILSFVGVIVLFFFAMPYRIRTGGQDALYGDQVDHNAIRREALHSKLAWIAVGLVSFGTIAQIVGAWVGY